MSLFDNSTKIINFDPLILSISNFLNKTSLDDLQSKDIICLECPAFYKKLL